MTLKFPFGHLFVFALTTLVLTSCGPSEKTVSYKSGDMTQTFAEGQNAIPQNFPLPMYPKSITTGSVSASNDKSRENSKFLMLCSNDSCEQVGQYYQQQLKSSGWHIESMQTLPKLINICATKNTLEANIMLSSDGKKTIISLSVSNDSDFSPTSGAPFTPNKLTPATD